MVGYWIVHRIAINTILLMNEYKIILFWSSEEDANVPDVPELPGCIAHSDTNKSELAIVKKPIHLSIKKLKESQYPNPNEKYYGLFILDE